MLPLKSKPNKENLYQVAEEINVLNGTKRESQNLRNICMICALFILISIVNRQSENNYSPVNRANWLLKQSGTLECMQNQDRTNGEKPLNIQGFSCQ